MSETIRILAFAGSTRTESFNKKLVFAAAKGAEAAGATVTLVDLQAYRMPLYESDWEKEHGLPETARALKQLFIEHHGILVASPEYNGSVTAVFKNTIDWLSRREEGEPRMAAFQNKAVGLLSCSPGKMGGIRGLPHARTILSNVGCLVMPQQLAIGFSGQLFDDDGKMIDEKQRAMVEKIGYDLAELTRRLHR